MDKLANESMLPQAKAAVKESGLYVVPEERLGELAEVAMDAYRDYPLHNWFCGGEYDPEVSRLIMDVSLKTMKEDAVIYADSEELNGFAVWLPPGFTGSRTLPFLLSGGLKLILRAGPGIVGRMAGFESFAMKLKESCTAHADWYLYNLSVACKAQGKGIAGKLMRPMLEFCDRENRLCYLETNKESNVDIYKRFGFLLKERRQVPKSEVMHYAMIREPAAVY